MKILQTEYSYNHEGFIKDDIGAILEVRIENIKYLGARKLASIQLPGNNGISKLVAWKTHTNIKFDLRYVAFIDIKMIGKIIFNTGEQIHARSHLDFSSVRRFVDEGMFDEIKFQTSK